MVRPESTMVPVSRYGSDPNSSAAPFNFCVCGAASCITGLFLQAGEPVPCTSRLFMQAAVHFARFLARVRTDAGIRGKCTASCKKSGEMHARPSSSWGSWRISPHAHSVKAETRGVLPRLWGKSTAYEAALSAL